MVEPETSPQATFRGIVALVGLRGSGKTTLGRALAERLQVPFLDLDLELASQHGQPDESSGALLERVGLERFRELESLTLAACLAPGGPLVLATGGGVVEESANRDLLGRSSRCIWLRASVAELGRRVQTDGTLRPSLTDLDPAQEMALLATRREALYDSLAELRCETEGRSPEVIVDEIFRHLSR